MLRSKGFIADGVRELVRADRPLAINFTGPKRNKPELVVTERGDTRCLPVSREVAEVLIARGMSYGA
jgi:hypothetical protein